MSAVEVLAQHQWSPARVTQCLCGAEFTEIGPLECDAHMAAHQLDVLKARGFAVLELPKVEANQYGEQIVSVKLPSQRGYRNRYAQLRVEPGRENHLGIQIPARIASLGIPTPTEAPDARSYAAALVAAADAAEAIG